MICILWGEDKSCKNTLGFSFPKPLVDMEFDIGGSRRALRNLKVEKDNPDGTKTTLHELPIKDWYDQGLIKIEPYVMPFQIGSTDPVTGIVRPSKIVVGVKELFYKFAGDFIKHLKDPNISTIMVDTGTLLYEATCLGYLQEKQELQLNPDGSIKPGRDNKPQSLRVQLQREEYREPYIRMRGFIYQAKAHGKHLVMTHHAADQYGLMRQSDGTMATDKTGKRELHGWKQLGDGADIYGRTYWQPPAKVYNQKTNQYDDTPGSAWLEIELAEVQEMKGMKLQNPTYDKIVEITKMIRGEA